MDTDRHAGAVAIVTGAASGIGRATALRLAGEGATVVATDINANTLATRGQEASGIVTVAGDITDESVVRAVVDEAVAVGDVSVVANVAGIMDHFVPVTELDDGLWHRVLEVNLTAHMRMCRAVIPKMLEHGSGVIVNVASVAGLTGGGAGAAYTASKHAVIGLTQHVAFTYAPQGIRCNVVCPGPVRTGIGPSAAPTVPWAFERQQAAIALTVRMAEPDEIAASVSWLASAEASNINGAVVRADGGWKSA
jgi:NAD(P)-dependent dehydrogenase (short-subunit alcohol dehydrogenase family)